MAQDRANRMTRPLPGVPVPSRNESAPARPEAPSPSVPAEPLSDRSGGLTKLLTRPEDGWEIDVQARVLKTDGRARSSPFFTRNFPLPEEGSQEGSTVRLPSPIDFGERTTELPNKGLTSPRTQPLPQAAPSAGHSSGASVASQGPAPSAPSRPPSGPNFPALAPSSRSDSDSQAQKARSKPPPLPQRAQGKPAPATSRPPPPLPKGLEASHLRTPTARDVEIVHPSTIVDMLTARLATLEGTDDTVGLARVHLELATVADALIGDDGQSVHHAKIALHLVPHLAPAHALLRRKRHESHALPEMVEHLEKEMLAVSNEAALDEFLVEKARLVAASGDGAEGDREAWERALARAPHHPAAIKGLEGVLVERALKNGPGAWDALSLHLSHAAEALAHEPMLAAWLHVERARIQEAKLGRVDAARSALERALELEPRVGPVREEVVRHVSSHDDALALSLLFEQEAELEPTDARAVRLELDAASIAEMRLGDVPRAIRLLYRAARRAPTVPSTDRIVLDKLIELLEQSSDWAGVAAVRRTRLHYITVPAARAHELRTLALLGERLGQLDQATEDASQALAIEGGDPTLVELIDRFLHAQGHHEHRTTLWLNEASRTDDGTKRARALTRAAQIAEREIGNLKEAIRHLRAAWVAAPGDSEVFDHLSRLLTPEPTPESVAEHRTLIDFYLQAASHARDPVRRVAYLEKAALLAEECLSDFRQAARLFQDILAIEPNRRGAILGTGRCAGRLGDDRILARSLLNEARLSDDGVAALGLRTRAAAALSKIDPARALSIVLEVLEQDPHHSAARALETRLHEEAGRWELAAASLRTRLDLVASPSEKLGLYFALAQIEDSRLRSPDRALEALQQARAIDPDHPVPPEAIARLLAQTNNFDTLRTALEALAASATTSLEKARYLIRAAEVDEFRLKAPARAARTYAQALSHTPDDPLIIERLTRLYANRAIAGKDPSAVPDFVALLTRQMESARDKNMSLKQGFTLASFLVEIGQDHARAASLLEAVIDADPRHVPALRTLEHLARSRGETAQLARVLGLQGDAFESVEGRRGALWNLVWLEEWRLPNADPLPTYHRIRELNPKDTFALDGILRREQPLARRGDHRAQKAMLLALRSMADQAPDSATSLTLELRLALMLEALSTDAHEVAAAAAAKESLSRYQSALAMDPLSVAAATGLARLANRLGDKGAAVEAAMALGHLSADPKAKARYFIDAGRWLASRLRERNEAYGPRSPERHRAIGALESALASDPDAVDAIALLSFIVLGDSRDQEGRAPTLERETDALRLLETLRAALRDAKSREATVALGAEVAKIARDELRDSSLAVATLSRVREQVPDHVPTLLALAELHIAQRAWPEAVETLETAVRIAEDKKDKLTALFALGSLFETILGRPRDAEKVLRAALELDSHNPRGLRALLRILTTRMNSGEVTGSGRVEVADYFQRLCDVEKDTAQKSLLLLELGELRIATNNEEAARVCLIESVALDPRNTRAFTLLGRLFRSATGRDHGAYAQALARLIQLGGNYGHADAIWFATLGQLEVNHLSRTTEGLANLKRAVQLDPSLFETRIEIAKTLFRLGGPDEALIELFRLVHPDATPLLSLPDFGGGLGLLEEVLTAAKRPEEAIVINEWRALGGVLDDGRHAWLRARRVNQTDNNTVPLDRAMLIHQVLPPEGRHALLEVAVATTGIEAKLFRADLAEHGISAKDRITGRGAPFTKTLLDRICRSLGVTEVELAISPTVERPRILAQDVPWIVVPRSLVESSEPVQIAALARCVARIALGTPWIEELDPLNVEAFLIACARQVVPTYGDETVDMMAAKLVAQYEPAVAKSLTRRHKKFLEDLAPHLAMPQHAPLAMDIFMGAIARAELRTAFILGGDLLATVDEIRALDPNLRRDSNNPSRNALEHILAHPYSGDICRFALSPEATALRRRVGSTWVKG